MTIALFAVEFGLSSVLIVLLNGKTAFADLASPTAVLLISLPIFAFLFLRLKKIELRGERQRFDPSKRRSTQFIQIANFVVTFLASIAFLTGVFYKLGGSYSGSITKLFLDFIVIFVIGVGVLLYYWRDEHKQP